MIEVLLHNLIECLRVKNILKKKLLADTGTRTNVVYFRRVLPSRVNALSYLQLRQTTTLSHHTAVVRKLANHTPRKINDL
jgi:hypothetical protein